MTISMNANIMKTQIFHIMKYVLKGYSKSYLHFKINFFFDICTYVYFKSILTKFFYEIINCSFLIKNDILDIFLLKFQSYQYYI